MHCSLPTAIYSNYSQLHFFTKHIDTSTVIAVCESFLLANLFYLSLLQHETSYYILSTAIDSLLLVTCSTAVWASHVFLLWNGAKTWYTSHCIHKFLCYCEETMYNILWNARPVLWDVQIRKISKYHKMQKSWREIIGDAQSYGTNLTYTCMSLHNLSFQNAYRTNASTETKTISLSWILPVFLHLK